MSNPLGLTVNCPHSILTHTNSRPLLLSLSAVAPATLESLLLSHPKVADCAVIPLHSKEQATELPLAFIVPSGSSSSQNSSELAKEVQDWVAGRVANHMKLRGGVRVREEIPKSPSGKILRRLLRDEIKKELEEGEGGAGPKAKL